MGPVARIMTRFLFSVVYLAHSWDNEVFLSSDSLSEIIFWKNNVVALNGKLYWLPHSLPVKVTYSDASISSCGAFVENSSPEENAQSSTRRELRAVSLTVEAFANHFSGFKVIWYTDNQSIESIILIGCRKTDLHQLALLVFQICLKFHILSEVKWIPRDLNAGADAMIMMIIPLMMQSFTELTILEGPYC